MNKNTLMILAAAGLGLYYVTKMTRPKVTASGADSLNNGGAVNVPSYTKSIFNTALPGQEGWGWQYFNDGTAIGPDGSYYTNGQKVWSPA
jgi:hypothetical protein